MRVQSLIIILIKVKNHLKRVKIIQILKKVLHSHKEIKVKQNQIQNQKVVTNKKHNKPIKSNNRIMKQKQFKNIKISG